MNAGLVAKAGAVAYVPMMPGALGPILWIVALVLSTIAIMQAQRETALR